MFSLFIPNSLSQILDSFIEGLEEAVISGRKLSEEQSREWQKMKADEHLRFWDVKRVEELKYFIAKWYESKKTRSFIAAVKANHKSLDIRGDINEWLAWAMEYADSIDPLFTGGEI